MRRRHSYDPLQTVNKPVWLVVADMTRRVIAWMEIPANTDLKARFKDIVAAASNARWTVEDHTEAYASFFCHRDNTRRHVGIQFTFPGHDLVNESWPLPKMSQGLDECFRE